MQGFAIEASRFCSKYMLSRFRNVLMDHFKSWQIRNGGPPLLQHSRLFARDENDFLRYIVEVI